MKMYSKKNKSGLLALVSLFLLIGLSSLVSGNVAVSISSDKTNYSLGDTVQFTSTVNITNESTCTLIGATLVIYDGSSKQCTLPETEGNYGNYGNCNLSIYVTETHHDDCLAYGGDNFLTYKINWTIPLNFINGTYIAIMKVYIGGPNTHNASTSSFSIGVKSQGTMKVSPPVKNVLLNDTFNINVNISSSAVMQGGTFNLWFNNSILNATAVVKGSFMTCTTQGDTLIINNSAGKVQVAIFCSSGGTVTGEGALATITFKAISYGSSYLRLGSAYITDSNANSMITTTQNGSVNVNKFADAGPDQWTYAGKEALTFDGSGSYDPNGTIITYSWTFGDGTQDWGLITTHDYGNNTGNYTVTLNVTDDAGKKASDTAKVTIYIPGDFNHNWCVGISDFSLFADAWKTNPGDPYYDTRADFTNFDDGSGFTINAMDLAKLALYYTNGPC